MPTFQYDADDDDVAELPSIGIHTRLAAGDNIKIF